MEVEMSEKCTPLWREAHFQVKMYKTHQCRTTFGSCDVEKVHAVVARSTFPSQNVQITTCSKSNFKKMLKTQGVRTTWRFRCRFDSLHHTTLHYTTLRYITRLHYTPLQYTPLHSTTLNYTTLHYTTLHYSTLPSTTLHYITLHYTPLHYNYDYTTTLHYTPLH